MSQLQLRRPNLLADPGYRQFQLNRIRPQIKILGSLASAVLLLMLPWDLGSESPWRGSAVGLRMVAVIQLYLIAFFWQKQWLERNFVSVFMALALVSFLALCGNYMLLPERTPYLFTLLFYFNIGFLVLAPLASTTHILLVAIVPTLVMSAFLLAFSLHQEFLVPFALHTLPFLLILNLAAWYIRAMAQDHYQLYRENTELATYDDLTGLLNRRAWESRSRMLLARARREGGSFALLLLDVDHFKRINDTWGHLVGDQVLMHVARVFKSGVRSSDLLGRYGGEEFAMILRNCSPAKGLEVAEKLRKMLRDTPMTTVSGNDIAVQVSIGVASFPSSGRTATEVATAADLALYRAKSAGRNRVEMA